MMRGQARLDTIFRWASLTKPVIGALTLALTERGVIKLDDPVSFAPDRMFNPNSYPSGGGGMSGTAGDFMRFLETMRTGGAPVLSRASFDLLRTVKAGDFEVMIPGWHWALGWPVLVEPAKTGTPQSPGSWLWGGVYGNSWFVDPSRELSSVLLTNTAVAGMIGAVPDAVRDAIYAAL